jgi:magnesium-transporting ATPase (P-type)
VQAADLRVDQSTLTGEAHPVRKTAEAVLHRQVTSLELPNLVFAGTSVAVGTGQAVVYATGMTSEFGKVARLTQTVGDELSPLQQEMVHTTKMVTLIAVSVGLLFFCAGSGTGRCDTGRKCHFCPGHDCGLCA